MRKGRVIFRTSYQIAEEEPHTRVCKLCDKFAKIDYEYVVVFEQGRDRILNICDDCTSTLCERYLYERHFK